MKNQGKNKKSEVRVGKLHLSRETLRRLDDEGMRKVSGGLARISDGCQIVTHISGCYSHPTDCVSN